MPTCSCTRRQAAQALIRILAIGESATSIAVTPASRSVPAAATSCAALNDRGGSISTVTTKSPAAIAACSFVGGAVVAADVSAATTGAGSSTRAWGPRSRTASAIARVCAGPVPQQPPMIATPSSRSARAISPT